MNITLEKKSFFLLEGKNQFNIEALFKEYKETNKINVELIHNTILVHNDIIIIK